MMGPDGAREGAAGEGEPGRVCAGGGAVTTPIGGKEDQLARPAGTGAPQALHRRSSPQGSSPRRPVEVSSGLLRLPRLHAPAVADDAARARRPSGHTAAPPPRRRSEPPRAPWYLKCPAALGDGVDAPRRHLRAKVTVSNCH